MVKVKKEDMHTSMMKGSDMDTRTSNGIAKRQSKQQMIKSTKATLRNHVKKIRNHMKVLRTKQMHESRDKHFASIAVRKKECFSMDFTLANLTEKKLMVLKQQGSDMERSDKVTRKSFHDDLKSLYMQLDAHIAAEATRRRAVVAELLATKSNEWLRSVLERLVDCDFSDLPLDDIDLTRTLEPIRLQEHRLRGRFDRFIRQDKTASQRTKEFRYIYVNFVQFDIRMQMRLVPSDGGDDVGTLKNRLATRLAIPVDDVVLLVSTSRDRTFVRTDMVEMRRGTFAKYHVSECIADTLLTNRGDLQRSVMTKDAIEEEEKRGTVHFMLRSRYLLEKKALLIADDNVRGLPPLVAASDGSVMSYDDWIRSIPKSATQALRSTICAARLASADRLQKPAAKELEKFVKARLAEFLQERYRHNMELFVQACLPAKLYAVVGDKMRVMVFV